MSVTDNMQNKLSKKSINLTKIAPGHGEVLDKPHEVVEWIINHRLQREEKVAFALKEVTKGNPESLVSKVYDDVDPSLFPIAKASLLAHLIKLEEKYLLKSSWCFQIRIRIRSLSNIILLY